MSQREQSDKRGERKEALEQARILVEYAETHDFIPESICTSRELLLSRALLAPSSTAATETDNDIKPDRPGWEMVEDARLSARYWERGARTEQDRESALMALHQAMLAYKNCAYHLAEKLSLVPSATSRITDDMIYGVCRRIRDTDEPCRRCPAVVETNHGPGVQMCRSWAEEICQFVVNAAGRT